MAIRRNKRQEPASTTLRGWNQIATYLGQPVATAQRWAKSGMPVRKLGRVIVSRLESAKVLVQARRGWDGVQALITPEG
jgi:hypothetical protein